MTENSNTPEDQTDLDITQNEEDLELISDQPKGFFRGIRRSVTKNAGRIGQLVANTGKAVAKQTGRAGKAVGSATVSTGKAIAHGGTVAGRQVIKTPERIGNLMQILDNSSRLRSLATKVKGLNFLLPLLDKIDVVKAQAAVANLQRKFPNESPKQISNRIITEKAIFAAGSGFVSSGIPGAAVTLFAGDLLTSTALQGEMVYQIAAAYGFDLESAERQGEIVTIFGLALGGNYAAKTGLKVIGRNIPIAGAVIGASSNAVLTFSLGKIACQFYEFQLKNSEAVEDEKVENLLEECQEANNKFLEEMIEQEIMMDEILAHMWLAANPEKNLSDLLAQILSLNISPASVEKLEKSSELVDLDTLLNNLSAEYLPTVLAKCKLVAKGDGMTTEEEREILTKLEEQVRK